MTTCGYFGKLKHPIIHDGELRQKVEGKEDFFLIPCSSLSPRAEDLMMLSKPTAPLSPKKGLEGIPEGLPPEEVERFQKLQTMLNDFVLHFIQAFLRTGYYTPDHPESIKAKEGLYERFKNLFEGEDELAFLVREEQEKQEILVEGVLPEAQKLSRMMRGMGELYVPKFAKYLERMVSLEI